MKHIRKIEVLNNIGETPARVSRSSGVLQINAAKWDDINKRHQPFILLHEQGHVALNTSNEQAADAWAFNSFISKGGTRKNAVTALTDNLNDKNFSHRQRAFVLLQRALLNQYKTTGDKKALEQYLTNKKNSFMNADNTTFLPPVSQFFSGAAEKFDNIFGLGKNAKAKKEIRLEKKKARVESIKSKNEARTTLADRGVVMPGAGDAIGKAIGGVASLASSVLGGGGAAVPSEAPVNFPPLPAIGNSSPVTQMLSPGGGAGNSIATPAENYDTTGAVYNTGSEAATTKKKPNTIIIAGIIAVVVITVIVLLKRK